MLTQLVDPLRDHDALRSSDHDALRSKLRSILDRAEFDQTRPTHQKRQHSEIPVNDNLCQPTRFILMRRSRMCVITHNDPASYGSSLGVLSDKTPLAYAPGKVTNKYRMAKHFDLTITRWNRARWNLRHPHFRDGAANEQRRLRPRLHEGVQPDQRTDTVLKPKLYLRYPELQALAEL
jgi:hypothetical protein